VCRLFVHKTVAAVRYLAGGEGCFGGACLASINACGMSVYVCTDCVRQSAESFESALSSMWVRCIGVSVVFTLS
jgi:hypothetical protein